MLVGSSAAEKSKSPSAFEHVRAPVYKQTALSEYNIPSTVLDRLRLQNTLDRIEKVS